MLIAGVLLATAIAVQTPEADTAEARRLLRRADSAFNRADAAGFKQASVVYHRALAIYENAHYFSGQASAANNLGRIAVRTGRPDSAVMYYRRAAALSHATDDSTNEGIFVNNIGDAFVDAHSPDSALYYFRQSVPLLSRTAKYAALGWYSLGRFYGNAGSLDSALANFARADSAANAAKDTLRADLVAYAVLAAYGDANRPDAVIERYPALLAKLRARHDSAAEDYLLNVVGLARRARGDFSGARATFREAFALARLRRNAGDEGQYLSNIATTFGDYEHTADSAVPYYRAAADARHRAGNTKSEALTLAYLADVYRSYPKYDSTIAILRRAVDLEHRTGYHLAEAHDRADLADVLEDVDRELEADEQYRLALKLARMGGDQPVEARALNGLGIVYTNYWGEPDTAAVYLRRAVDVARRGSPDLVATALTNLGAALEAQNKPDTARLVYIDALETAKRAKERSLSRYYSMLGDLYTDMGRDSAKILLEAGVRAAREESSLGDEADALRMLGRWYQVAASPRRLDLAGQYYDSSIAIGGRIARVFKRDVERVRIAEQNSTTYDAWVSATLNIAADGAITREAALRALAVSERSRSQALLRLVRERAQNEANVVQAGGDLLSEGAAVLRATSLPGTTTLAYHSTYDTLVIWVLRDRDSVTAHVRRIGWDSLSTLVAELRDGLQTDGAGSRGLVLEKRDAADSAPDTQRGLHARGNRPAVSTAVLSELRTYLLPPEVLAELPPAGELLIVPHGPLSAVPFAALSTPDGMPLGERFAIRYAPSLTTLAAIAEGPGSGEGRADASWLSRSIVVANPRMPVVTDSSGNRVRLPALDGAGAEGRWLAARLKTTRLLTGPDANLAALRGVITDSVPIIHFATHGYAYSSDAHERDSFIALSPRAADDGLLTITKILDSLPRLHADLVVLSACQTGLGNLAQAEGTIGLQRAFIARGAQSVLVSLWNVSDDATALLMRQFYSHWLDDRDSPSKSEALRRAQSDVRQKKQFEQPRYWAAFQLVGAR
ncbi:MAG TPA: CHAT domain-containing tetratricopeptide repeat protein [Gemmatimonadaceae bacterium]|nr:CHAT domain-containing tetratricopeptide repeat protein [Gemmatimonadaceae bacterium]